MSNRNKLTSDQLQTHLLDLPEWQGNDQGISRTFGFKTYGDGVAFAIKVTPAGRKNGPPPGRPDHWLEKSAGDLCHP